jgi:hypothetical protein
VEVGLQLDWGPDLWKGFALGLEGRPTGHLKEDPSGGGMWHEDTGSNWRGVRCFWQC